jgi:hypothetical protein
MKYRKKVINPDEIEACKLSFCPEETTPKWIDAALASGKISVVRCYRKVNVNQYGYNTTVAEGDYLIQGARGEILPCKAYIFEKTYEPC